MISISSLLSRPVALIGLALAAAALAPAQSYVPHAVEVPKGASYVLADGAISIVGNDGMEDLLNKWNELFTKTHPGFKFTMLLKGSSTGIGGLTAGVSAFGPMGREAWPTDVAGFKETFGYEPFDVRIGWGGYSRPKHKNPPAIYVNAGNPLAGLTVAQVARIFTHGAPGGDVTSWGQLGVKGAWAHRAIHLYGPRDEGGFATSIRTSLLGKRPFAPVYEGLPKLADVIAAVAADPFGIGLVGFFDSSAMPEVRIVPLAAGTGASYALPTDANVSAGLYPLTPALHIYVNRAPGRPLDPLVKEYLRLVLSPEGQAVIAAEKDSDNGYLPLSPSAAAQELTRLE
ncbi:MAG: substrate-binding domain-containing protein [Opitutaceae bacterium]